MKRLPLFSSLTLSLLTLFAPSHASELPEVVAGKLIRHANFESQHVAARNIDVWLPPRAAPNEPLPVLYMHDGQMLYDSNATWNGQTWDADDVATKLIRDGKTPPFIIVGIWNGGPELRHREYFPQKAFENLSENDVEAVLQGTRKGQSHPAFPGEPISDKYLRFIVEELKPFIDKTYSTISDRDSTFISGSSMGGLISTYALCEYPDTFGGAACLSTHWPGIFTNEDNPIPQALFTYLDANLPDPNKVRLYFDLGDQTLDALYEPHQVQVDKILRRHGYDDSNWISKRFPGTDHSEIAWNARLHEPLIFLLDSK
ncbi:alpha/beta hydrolase-fold protein [Pelagicoccus mobilis]|uniref:Alpha/beta hydrolase n=1 Tax=Pelagicoccus mobilis TaxID=415221 RepID=A0A934RYJ3_9BACT|nr:alpha/beta hydrolase-fold protein [Pelagicoccus mobilis]MBK1876204.1 alpha/beta hydrolase [Pelagicoccus mobilis]